MNGEWPTSSEPVEFRYLEPQPGAPKWVIGARVVLVASLVLWVLIFLIGFVVSRALT